MDGRRPGWLGLSRGWLLAPGILLAGLGLGLLGIHALSGVAREHLHQTGRDQVAFVDIDCPPPPGRTRVEFLREVRYQNGLPARLSLFEDDLPHRLARAFATHPWVAHVKRIEIGTDRQVHVQLLYRAPVLAVVVAGAGAVHSFQVDKHGVHLGPVHDSSLPVYRLPLATRLDERSIQAAAATVAYLRPDQAKLGLKMVEGSADRLILRGAWPGPVVWGHAPGAEASGEAAADKKRSRLLEHIGQPNVTDEALDLR